ncbi:MAG TPA: hypothetical protein VET85_13760 [Stellaceae bacterium]|nr:hypothetical protein [Stellaceae bacterium]
MLNRSLVTALVLVSFGMASAARADSANFVGKWHWSQKESSSVPGEPPPRDVLLTITSADAKRAQWSLAVVDDKGEKHTESFTGAADGKPTPVAGGANGMTAEVKMIGAALDITYKVADGSSDHVSCSVSADNNKMTCRGTESDGKGHSANYVDVYNRQ